MASTDTTAKGASEARECLLTVLPPSGFTFDVSGADAYVFASIGFDGPSISATWDNGRYAHGRIGDRPYASERTFLNALARVTGARSRGLSR
jgi:hypothetical protein